MSEKIKVLDHGYVQLIDKMGTDETIIEAARMSTGRGFEGWDKDMGLLTYLYKNGHHSPFEMCELAIEVQAPIFVVREWQRHRTQSYNEFSARYSKMEDLHYLPPRHRITKQSITNKQGSSGELLPSSQVDDTLALMEEQQNVVYSMYSYWLAQGVSKEVARINTPVSRYTRMRTKANLRNWFGFLNLRLRENAQWEIRQYARVVADIIFYQWPRSYNLFVEWDLHSRRLSGAEAMEYDRYLETKKNDTR